jgi:hypothetical protein
LSEQIAGRADASHAHKILDGEENSFSRFTVKVCLQGGCWRAANQGHRIRATAAHEAWAPRERFGDDLDYALLARETAGNR